MNQKTKTCDECKSKVPWGAKRCMHCGIVFKSPSSGEWVDAKPPKRIPMHPQKEEADGCVWAILAVVGILILAGVWKVIRTIFGIS